MTPFSAPSPSSPSWGRRASGRTAKAGFSRVRPFRKKLRPEPARQKRGSMKPLRSAESLLCPKDARPKLLRRKTFSRFSCPRQALSPEGIRRERENPLPALLVKRNLKLSPSARGSLTESRRLRALCAFRKRRSLTKDASCAQTGRFPPSARGPWSERRMDARPAHARSFPEQMALWAMGRTRSAPARSFLRRTRHPDHAPRTRSFHETLFPAGNRAAFRLAFSPQRV